MSKQACVSSLVMLFAAQPVVAEAKVRIKLGTLAPDGSAWHDILLRMGQRWKAESKGEVQLKVYPGGVAGDEFDMVRKMRIGQLHGATITGLGLAQISRANMALQVPMMFRSWAQLDYVRDRIGPKIAAEMNTLGFVVLAWGDAGWVHNFSKVRAQTPDDYRKLKLFVRAGDPATVALWRASGFDVVPLSPSDVLSALQTGMIDAFGTTPLFGLSSQWFGLAKYMVRVNWSPLNGGTVVSRAQWERIDPALRPALVQIAAEEGAAMRTDVRALNEKAVKAMRDRGLEVIDPSAEVIAQWRSLAESTWPRIRGAIVPAPYFDEVRRLADEYRPTAK